MPRNENVQHTIHDSQRTDCDKEMKNDKNMETEDVFVYVYAILAQTDQKSYTNHIK